MTEGNLDAIQRELKLREVRRKGVKLLSGRERYDFLGIKEKIDLERQEAEALYRKEYKTRVDVAYRVLMRKAASPAPELKPRFVGSDRFDRQRLQRRAEQIVRFEHEGTMARLDEKELKESHSFLDRCTERRSYAQAFRQTADRRKQERRKSPVRNESPTISD